MTVEEERYAQEVSTWTSDKIYSAFDCSYDKMKYLGEAIVEKDIFNSIRELQEKQNQRQCIMNPDEIVLPPKEIGDRRLTLVLDLDETLIRAEESLVKYDREEVVCFLWIYDI